MSIDAESTLALVARIRELEAERHLSLEATPEILAAGWGAINRGRTRPVDMAPGPALREAWPAMVRAARDSKEAADGTPAQPVRAKA